MRRKKCPTVEFMGKGLRASCTLGLGRTTKRQKGFGVSSVPEMPTALQ